MDYLFEINKTNVYSWGCSNLYCNPGGGIPQKVTLSWDTLQGNIGGGVPYNGMQGT